MKFDHDSPEAQKRLGALIEEMNGQTDRGVAIVGSAWVEEALSALIEWFLHSDPKVWERLFKNNGPIATFSAKIDLAKLLGLISEIIRSDLHRIRDIRNELAHEIAHKTEHTRLTFDSAHLRDRCFALKCVSHEKHSTPRAAFIRACAILNADLETVRFFGMKISDGGKVIAKVEEAQQIAAADRAKPRAG